MGKAVVEGRQIVSASLPREDARRLEKLAAEADRTLSAQLRRAVREQLARTEPREAAR